MLPIDLDIDNISYLFGVQLRRLPLEEQAAKRGGKNEFNKRQMIY